MTRPVLLLAAVGAVSGVLLLQSRSGSREQRYARMDEPALGAWIAVHPRDALAHVYLGVARGRSGDPAEGIRLLRRGLELEPKLAAARLRLARVLGARGDVAAAEAVLQDGIRRGDRDPRLHAELGRLREARGDWRAAASAWETACALAPAETELWLQLSRCRLAANDPDGALTAGLRAAAREDRSAAYQSAVADALRVLGRHAESESRYRQALRLQPGDPGAHAGLARLLRDRDGSTAGTEVAMREAVRLQSGDPALRYALAGVLEDRGDLKAAAEEYRATLRMLEEAWRGAAAEDWPGREQRLSLVEGPHFRLAGVLARLGQTSAAAPHRSAFQRLSGYRNQVRRLRARLAYRPEDAALHFELARAHRKAGDVRMAESEFRSGLRIADHPGARAELLALVGRRRGPDRQ